MSSLSVAHLYFCEKGWKQVAETEAASFHGGITVSLLFCTPEISIVQYDEMVGKGSLGNNPTISKREFPQFSLLPKSKFPSKSLGNWTLKQSKPPFTPLLLVINYWGIAALPAKADMSWVMCTLVTVPRDPGCWLLFQECGQRPWHPGQRVWQTWSSSS